MNRSNSSSDRKSIIAQAGLWKWVATILISILGTAATTGFGTAYAFRVSDEHITKIASKAVSDDRIGKVARKEFTENSREHGLYKIEGQPRIKRVEDAVVRIAEGQSTTNEKLIRLSTQIEALTEQVKELRNRGCDASP